MNSQVKITSNEGGSFNAQNNHVSFDIPAGKQYDLSAAYLNLVMSAPITSQVSGNVTNIGGETARGAALDATSVYIPTIRFMDTGQVPEDIKYENSALLRSIKMDCELRGNIEDIQRCDVLTHNLNGYSKSAFQQTSHLYERLCSEFSVSRTKGSVFNEIHKEGSVISRNLQRVPVRIKLSDVMNFCKTTQYNTGKYGKTRITCELNLDRLAVPRQYLGNAIAPGQAGANATREAVEPLREDWLMNVDSVLIPTNRTATELALENPAGRAADRFNATVFSAQTGGAPVRMMNADPTPDPQGNATSQATVTATCNRPNALTGVSATAKSFYVAADSNPHVANAPTGGTADAANTAFTMTTGGKVPRIFNRLEDSPFYVGQKLRVSCNTHGNGVGAAGLVVASQNNPFIRQIIAIDYNRGDGAGSQPQGIAAQGGVNVPGAICITLNAPLPGIPSLTAQYVDVVFTGATCTFGAVRCDFAELVLEELSPQNVVAEPDTISYSTFKTEEIDCASTNSFQHQFRGESNAMNLYIMQPSNNTNGTINSYQGLIDNYRIRVNNKDTSSRQIFLRDSGTANTDSASRVRGLTNDPLHLHKQQSALVNSDRVVKNLQEAPLSTINNDGTLVESYPLGRATRNGGTADNLLIGQVLPLTAQPKTIQVSINARTQTGGVAAQRAAAAGIKNLIVFQEVMSEV